MDTRLKLNILPHDCYCLSAGRDDEINTLVRNLRAKLRDVETVDETNITTLIRETLNERKQEKAGEFTNGKFAVSFDDFRNFGREKFPEELFQAAWSEIARITVGASLIIVNMGRHGDLIVETTEDCQVSIKDQFATIGEGKILAWSSLLSRNYSDTMSLGDALYCVYEAKRAAEQNSSVSANTTMRVLFPDGSTKRLKPSKMTFLKELYEKAGPRPLPAEITIPDDVYFDEEKPSEAQAPPSPPVVSGGRGA